MFLPKAEKCGGMSNVIQCLLSSAYRVERSSPCSRGSHALVFRAVSSTISLLTGVCSNQINWTL